ncbi:MAG: hypothetical protein JSV79_03870 [Armatimonadota bacterium]|nr:MAG: hypothetical protein JSV79_03870 [Armatimonadota bacterium]
MADTLKTCRKRGARLRLAFAWLSLLILSVAVVLGVGCGQKAGPTSGDAGVDTEGVVLPEWAPEHPSAAFLRAAKVLKPLPVGEASDPISAARAAANHLVYAAAYEVFGTLSDEQMEHLLAAKEIRIPVKTMSDRQRATVDNWFEAGREAERIMGGSPAVGASPDRLVLLYRQGAEKDLSNAALRFRISGHAVNIGFAVRRPDGSEFTGGNTTFATI